MAAVTTNVTHDIDKRIWAAQDGTLLLTIGEANIHLSTDEALEVASLLATASARVVDALATGTPLSRFVLLPDEGDGE